MNTAPFARALLLAALFGSGATAAFASSDSCVACHSNEATMKRLVAPPSGGSAEGEG